MPEPRVLWMRAAGALVRPEPGPAQRALLDGILADAAWRPLPDVPALRGLRPLAARAAVELGTEYRRLHSAAPPSPAERAQWVAKARLRQDFLRAFLAAWRGTGGDPVLLTKGAVLWPRYPSPALRPMRDIDIVAQPADAPALARLLERMGCARGPSPASEYWRHPSGLMLDVHAPSGLLGREVFGRAVDMDLYGTPVLAPGPAHHVVLVCLHALHHHGGRIWRDVADLHALLDGDGGGAGTAAEALDIAARHGCGAPVGTVLAFADRWSRGDARWSGGAEVDARLARLLGQMALFPGEAGGLADLRSLRPARRDFWRRAAAWAKGLATSRAHGGDVHHRYTLGGQGRKLRGAMAVVAAVGARRARTLACLADHADATGNEPFRPLR